METKKELPIEHRNVMITYEGEVTVRDKYYDRKEKAIVTRRAFYSKSNGYYNRKDEWVETPNGYFSVPQYWTTQYWEDGTTSLMPETFYQYPRVFPDQVIEWRYDE